MQLFGKLKGKPLVLVHDTLLHLHECRGAEHTHFIRLGSLESFLRKEIGIEESAALAYLSDGRRLRTDNVRDLAGAQDQVCVALPFCSSFAMPFHMPLHAHNSHVGLRPLSNSAFPTILLLLLTVAPSPYLYSTSIIWTRILMR